LHDYIYEHDLDRGGGSIIKFCDCGYPNSGFFLPREEFEERQDGKEVI